MSEDCVCHFLLGAFKSLYTIIYISLILCWWLIAKAYVDNEDATLSPHTEDTALENNLNLKLDRHLF